MKKDQRLVYITLAEEIGCPLCFFCKNGENEAEGCCEGYTYCVHPIEKLCEQSEDGLAPGVDCWGFYPDMPVTLLVDFVGAILSQEFEEWGYIRYSREAITIYGRHYNKGQEVTGKVRLGHTGKPDFIGDDKAITQS